MRFEFPQDMKADHNLARQMAIFGQEMNLDINDDYERILKEHRASGEFSAAIACAFTWTGHAIWDDDFFGSAIDFLNHGSVESLKAAKEFSGRFGKDGLSDALKAWRVILENKGDLGSLEGSAAQLKSTQDDLYRLASRLRRQREILGIGAWLFCAPFKIVALHHRDFWASPALDDVLMPLGLEVVRGARKLVRSKSAWASGIDLNMLTEEEGGIQEGMGTVCLVQECCKKMATASESRVVHINSGLYLHGKVGIENAEEELETMFG